MSSADPSDPKDPPAPERADSLEDAPSPVMSRAQEAQHVQERFSRISNKDGRAASADAAPIAPPAPAAPSAPASAAPPADPLRAAPAVLERAARPPSARRADSPRRSGLGSALWLASSACGLAAAVLFFLPLARTVSPETTTVVTYVPSDPVPAPEAPAETDSVTREETSPFQGYVLVIESVPEGASVRINGENHGTTPSSVGLECSPGSPIKIDFALKGYERAAHVTTCQTDTMVKVMARMRKPGARAPR